AARNVFADLGYGATTVRDIIRATELASGTFYNYFKSKEEVFQALQDETALRVRPRLRSERIRARNFEEFITGFDELKADIENAIEHGVLPPADPDLLMASMVGVAFEVAHQMLVRDDV